MFVIGDVSVNDTVPFPFDTFDADGASVTISGFAVTDIEIFKDGGATTRASDNGYTLLDTDGVDHAGDVGCHGFSVDFSDNSVAGFYVAGSYYWVRVSAITVDGQTVRFTYFVKLVDPPATATDLATVDANVDSIKADVEDGTHGLSALRTKLNNIDADIVLVKADTVAALADTNELQQDWTNGGRLDLLLDSAITHLVEIKGVGWLAGLDDLVTMNLQVVDNNNAATDAKTAAEANQTTLGVAGAGLTAIPSIVSVTGSVGSVTGNVTVGDITTPTLAKFATEDTGETSGATGSVVKLSQGAGGGGGDVTSIMGTALTEAAGGRLAAGLSYFFDVATPSKTMNQAGGDATEAKQDQILGKFATTTLLSQPVDPGGQITKPLVIGSDYLTANGRGLSWTKTAITGVVPGTATCQLGFFGDGGEGSEERGNFMVQGTITDLLDGNWRYDFDITKADTDGVITEGEFEWAAQVTDASGNEHVFEFNIDDQHKAKFIEKQGDM